MQPNGCFTRCLDADSATLFNCRLSCSTLMLISISHDFRSAFIFVFCLDTVYFIFFSFYICFLFRFSLFYICVYICFLFRFSLCSDQSWARGHTQANKWGGIHLSLSRALGSHDQMRLCEGFKNPAPVICWSDHSASTRCSWGTTEPTYNTHMT